MSNVSYPVVLISKDFSLQTWYLGFVVSIALVLCTVFVVSLSKRKRIHYIVWLPTLLMIFCCFAVSKIDLYTIVSQRENREANYAQKYLESGDSEDFQIIEDEVYYTVSNSVNKWEETSLWYILFTAVLSLGAAAALGKILKTHKVAVLNTCIIIMAIVALLCVIDRYTAISAKIIFSIRYGDETSDEENPYVLEWEGTRYVAYYEAGFSRSISRDYVLSKDVTVYSKPSKFSEKVCVLKKGTTTENLSYLLWTEREHLGWGFAPKIFVDERYYDENGYPRFTYEGYINIKDLVSACVDVKSNGCLSVVARNDVLRSEMVCFSSGYCVAPNIMFSFTPFELYLLIPITSIMLIIRLLLIIEEHRGKKKNCIEEA